MTREGQHVAKGHQLVPLGRRTNNKARAQLYKTLNRLTYGDWRERIGTHGRNWENQLAWQMLEDPLGTLQWINDHTPDDEGNPANAANPLIANNIGALYITAMQRAAEMKTIEAIEPASSHIVPNDDTEW